MREFDAKVIGTLKPHYYGRYVDDLLFVLPPDGVRGDDPIHGVLHGQFCRSGLIDCDDNGYFVCSNASVRLQRAKCLLHYFDKNNSSAGLENFLNRLKEQASEFRDLPDDSVDRPFKEVAWDLFYDGSEATWRSVTGIGEDKNALARYLHKRCILALFTDHGEPLESLSDLELFFKGRNALQYHDLWERLFTLLTMTRSADVTKRIAQNIENALGKLRLSPDLQAATADVISSIRMSLSRHLLLSRALACAAAGYRPLKEDPQDECLRIAATFAATQMARHYFMSTEMPVADRGSLLSPTVMYRSPQLLPDGRESIIPRFIPLDELMVEELLATKGCIEAQKVWNTVRERYLSLNRVEIEGVAVSENGAP